MAKKRGPHGPYTPEATRQGLRDAALSLFEKQGYPSTSVQMITDAAGVTKGAFYHHYESKDDVLLEIHSEFTQRMLDEARRIEASDLAPIDKLRQIIVRSVETFGNYRAQVAVFYQEYRFVSHETESAVVKMHREEREITLRIIDAAQAAGQLRDSVDARLLLYAISGATVWVYQWYRESGPLRIEDIAEGLADILLEGAAAD